MPQRSNYNFYGSLTNISYAKMNIFLVFKGHKIVWMNSIILAVADTYRHFTIWEEALYKTVANTLISCTPSFWDQCHGTKYKSVLLLFKF